MGTVGLSFGSPTSGAGFNVSTTVAEIVGNLQNVETPWKTQLTALQSQDTAISSLGTLFSSLSNDVSSLTELQGVMSQKLGSSSDPNVLTLTSANASAVAGTHTVTVKNLAQTSSGYLTAVTHASDKLSGSITLGVGSGATQTITLNSSDNTLAGLASAFNSSGVGITASVLTDASGSRLSLVSGTSGANGNLNIPTISNTIVDTTNSNAALSYTNTVAGKDASLTVDGIQLTSASNTVANLIPGVTFQLLAPSAVESDSSLEQIQVVISNDNSGVESTVNQFVTDYNSLMSAINTQEGYNSSGVAEPLFGSPTLSLLQQQLLGGLNTANPSGSLDSVAANSTTTFSGSMTIAVGSGTAQNIVFGAAPSSPPANTIYTGSGTNNLASLASAINAGNIGVTATVVTNSTGSSLSLLSQTTGASGALSVGSSIVATSAEPLTYSGTPATSTNLATGTLTSIPNASDGLTGSISIQVGTGTAQNIVIGAAAVPPAANTIYTGSGANTLADIVNAINNNSSVGVTASVVTNGDGTSSLSMNSNTIGSAGNLSVSSSILDPSNPVGTTLNYNNSSDIGGLTGLGISVNNDGTISLDVASLDSTLNSDYTGVVGFFQNVNSWGQSFSTMLSNAGTSSVTGVLSLASSSNKSIESTLNADISKEESLISAQQKSLTAESNSANEIMQGLPTELAGVNELYSAITGYNQNGNG